MALNRFERHVIHDKDRQWVMKESNLSPSTSQINGNGFTDRREEHHPVNNRE